jgi:hypothetical protein
MRNAGMSNSFRSAAADQEQLARDGSPQRHSLAPEHTAALQQMQLLEQQLQARSNSPFAVQQQQTTSRSVSPQPVQYSSASAAVTEHMLQWQKHQQRRSNNSSTSPVRSGSPLSLNGHNHLGSMPLCNPYQQMLLGGSYASAAGYMHHQPLHAAALLAAAVAAAAPVAIPLPLPQAHHHSLAAAAAHTAAQQQYAAAAAARAVRGWSTASNGGSTASDSPVSAPVRGGKGGKKIQCYSA